ncbi:AAA family ATPase [Enterovibrio paralichthyis]|uniref:AAA family ATPase n=1 Tax=Enterovibrio paralichthyis TaxID=2853805 RepID=UPI0006D20233|nr:AAA family ATPase [Enterovibrio paralichthyis]MBV7299805.1 AAA family ATPase [Enterovibrio paralichthyis]
MTQDFSNIDRVSVKAAQKLEDMSVFISSGKEEFGIGKFNEMLTKSKLAELPMLSKAIVKQAVIDMKAAGYVFPKRKYGGIDVDVFSHDDIRAIYRHRGVPTYRERFKGGFTLFVGNLKGGVSKTVSTVNLAHALRTHPDLIKDDLRILVIDIDPQSSATMFLAHSLSYGDVQTTAIQAMLNDLPASVLKESFITESSVSGVDVMVSSIDDAFIASEWENLCEEHLPGQAKYSVLRENVIDRLADDYDLVFVDCGPHLDSCLLNTLGAADLLLTPIPPSQVDFHSTCKYLIRLPDLYAKLQESGTPRPKPINLGYMTKVMTEKKDHLQITEIAKEIFGGNMLDEKLPRLDGFERCGETFDTTISANPETYPGSISALTNAKKATYKFARSLMSSIEYIRSDEEK